MRELLIGVVGKPSAGKSTFFNAVAEKSSAKMGAYPFTTIEPNHGVAFYETECPCTRSPVDCDPEVGSCENGLRKVPVHLLDIAGLIPNAHAGEGLGNKFLDDIRQADVLLHIVDISGTTNEKGETTIGYCPTGDHVWLMSEITEWIFNNFWGHWPSIVRKSSNGTTDGLKVLHEKLSGYNCQIGLVKTTLEKCGYSGLIDYSLWTKDDVHRFCEMFVSVRFPTVLVLNKSEKGFGQADAHVANMTSKYPKVKVILASALSELQLRKWAEEGFIQYCLLNGTVQKLKEFEVPGHDELFQEIADFVLFRAQSTGTQLAIQAAVELLNRTVVFPVDNLAVVRNQKGASFSRAILIDKKISIKDLSESVLHRDVSGVIAETIDGSRISSDVKIETLAAPNVIRISIGNKSIFEK